MEYLTKEQVQKTLDNLGTKKQFYIVFETKSGGEREYTGFLVSSENRSDSVAMETEQGFKRFNIGRVFMIGYYND